MPSSVAYGTWIPGGEAPSFSTTAMAAVAERVREPAWVVRDARGAIGVGIGGRIAAPGETTSGYSVVGIVPPLYPEWLGDRSFTERYGLRFAYVAGAMANGIATPRLVEAMAHAGMLGFYGAAGLPAPTVAAAIDHLEATLTPAGLPWGANLIHSPNEPALEQAVVELYLDRGVRLVSASAYMALTPHLVRFAYRGVHRDASGAIVRPRAVFAKVSRPEVCARFLSPPPTRVLSTCVESGWLTPTEAELAATLPVAEDVIVESDSGGHTDNRPLSALFATLAQVRDECVARYGYTRPIRLGAAGGIGTPAAAAAAFGLGAAFVLTGSVNQAAVESGLAPEGRAMLAQAGIADIGMAPAADMFEQGVEVQVLTRGTMFAARARRLYQLYRQWPSLEAIPADERARLEREILGAPVDEVWASTRAFFAERDPAEVQRAADDPKHRMALVFRWYLGLSSRWAIDGTADRRVDWQIWCGPAMGAFNAWVRGTHLEPPSARTATEIARNLLEGAAIVTRAGQLRSFGAPVPASAFAPRPRPLSSVVS
jgi:PfaD family protein